MGGLPRIGNSPAFICLASTALLLGAIGCAPAAGQTQQRIVLRELLNQRYAWELVSYPFSASRGACVADSVQLIGPKGPQAAQLYDVELWPNSQHVKSARLAFVVEGLEPLATATYTLTYGRQAAGGGPATDLKVAPGEGYVEIATGRIGVRLAVGEQTHAEPVPAATVPGPLKSLRLAGGPWAGGSRWEGEGMVKSWSARLTDAGPVFARVGFACTLADGGVAAFSALVAAGDNTVRWEMDVHGDRPGVRLDFQLPPVPGVKEALFPKGYGQWARADRRPAVTPSDAPFCTLAPDTSIVNAHADYPPCIRLTAAMGPADGAEVQLRSRDPGAWVDPVKPMTYAGYPKWTLDAVEGYMTNTWRRKGMPVSYAADGTVMLRVTLAQGRRKWSVSAGDPVVGEQLNRVKEMVLEWPQTTHHPHIFMTRAELEEAVKHSATTDPQSANRALPVFMRPAGQRTPAERDQIVGQLRDQLAKLGNFDVMRGAIGTAGLYDALIDSDLLTPQERALFRAQAACLAYVLADPMCWSMERGYLSGNPNMSISYTLSLGIFACLLPDHPMAGQWADYCDRWMDKWLSDEVGAQGEWLSEGVSYGGQVSLTPLLAYATAAKRAGYRDFTNDPRLKKLVLYFAKQYVPPDPRRNNMRVSPPVGRAHAWQTSGYLGLAAKMTAKTDPAFSRALQWMWAQGNYPMQVGDTRLGGFESFYLDKTLPAEAPAWGTAFFPALGAVLRDGFNTPHEHYLNLLSHVDSRRNLDIWVADVGIVAAWFAYGKPVSAGFNFGGSYHERHELLRNGVMLARNYDGAGNGKAPFGYYTETIPGALTALPGADYVCATYRITKPDNRDWFPEKLPAWPAVTPATEARLTWTRQALFVRDADPAGPHWLLLRDTAAGGQPTEWQFWTLSEKLGTREQARDAGFLAEKPGKAILPVRALPPGDRYTAAGQYDVDIEYFIAGPAHTPRHTLRYGGASFLLAEYQDLLHLQLPGDGAYYVAVFPRPRAEQVPAFAALADGKIIKVAGAFGTDYAFLATDATTATAEDVRVAGTAAGVQVRPAGTTLSLAAAGEVQWKAFGLQAPHAAAMHVAPDALTLSLPVDHPGGTLTVIAPAGWGLKKPAAGVKLAAGVGGCALTVPKGVTSVTMVKGE